MDQIQTFSFANIAKNNQTQNKSPYDSPNFSGNPTAPTADITNSQQIANVEFVLNYFDKKIAQLFGPKIDENITDKISDLTIKNMSEHINNIIVNDIVTNTVDEIKKIVLKILNKILMKQ